MYERRHQPALQQASDATIGQFPFQFEWSHPGRLDPRQCPDTAENKSDRNENLHFVQEQSILCSHFDSGVDYYVRMRAESQQIKAG